MAFSPDGSRLTSGSKDQTVRLWDVASGVELAGLRSQTDRIWSVEFSPGGTNFPHAHDTEEEMYLLMQGKGQMVAGGGMDGIMGKHPAKAGDAYFYRLNCTVGFFASTEPSSEKAIILAARSLYPRRRR